jgi:hypothetical protein
LALQVNLTDVGVAQRHVDLCMAKEFLDLGQAGPTAQDFGGIRVALMPTSA